MAFNDVAETKEGNNFGQMGSTWDYESLTVKSASGYVKPIPSFPFTGGYRGFGWKLGNTFHNGADYKTAVGTPSAPLPMERLFTKVSTTGLAH